MQHMPVMDDMGLPKKCLATLLLYRTKGCLMHAAAVVDFPYVDQLLPPCARDLVG